MKKLLAISLTVIMLFALAAPIMAADTKPFMIGETGYDTLEAAISAAQAGDTITMTQNVSLTGITSDKYNLNKNLTIDGGGFDFIIEASAANQFPFAVKNGANVTVKNFGTLSSTGGGFNVSNGTLSLEDLTLSSKGRAAAKGTGTSVINITDATVTMGTDAGTTEATMLLQGSSATLNMNEGAVVSKNQKANNQVATQSAVIYTTDAGTKTINMKSGSKIVANHAAGGSSTASVLGTNGATDTFNLNMEAGSYLVVDSTSFTTINFVWGDIDDVINLNVHDGAFLIKDGLACTPNNYTSDVNGGGALIPYVALETSPVAGYTAYKLNKAGAVVVENFKYINAQDVEVITGSIKTALTGAKEGSTITLLKDLSISETGAIVNKAITLDLNGKTLTNTGAAYAFSSVTKPFTVKNGTMKLAGGFVVQNGGVLTLDGVTLSAQISGSYVRPMIKLSGTGGSVSNGKISDAKTTTTAAVIKDSTVTSWNANNEALILVEHATDGTLDIVGNSVVKYQGPSGGGVNNSAIAVQQSWTGDSSLSADAKTEYNNRASSNTDVVINIGAGATVVCGHATNTATKIAMIINDSTFGNITVNLDKDAIVKFDRDPGASTSQFITNDNKGTVTVNDKGAKYVISPAVAKVGAVLPANLLGYKLGETVISSNTFIDAAATAEITLTAVEIDYAMIKGAAIRTTLPFGLRFSAILSKDIYDAILAKDPNAKFGFAFRRDIDGAAEFGNDYEMMDAGKVVVGEDGNVIVYKTLTIDPNGNLLTAENRTNFRKVIAARAYIKLMIDGEEVVYWTDYNVDENSRSIYNVAKAYYEDTVNGSTENKVVNYILEKSGYSF